MARFIATKQLTKQPYQQLDIAQYAAGMYFLKIRYGERELQALKLVKQ